MNCGISSVDPSRQRASSVTPAQSRQTTSTAIRYGLLALSMIGITLLAVRILDASVRTGSSRRTSTQLSDIQAEVASGLFV